MTHFFGTVGGESLLIADWSLFREEEKAALVRRTSRVHARVAGQEFEALVAAMSQTVADLSREIESVINSLARGAPIR